MLTGLETVYEVYALLSSLSSMFFCYGKHGKDFPPGNQEYRNFMFVCFTAQSTIVQSCQDDSWVETVLSGGQFKESCTMAENGKMDRHSYRLHLCAILYYFVFKRARFTKG